MTTLSKYGIIIVMREDDNMGFEAIQILASERKTILEKLKTIKTVRTREELNQKYDELTKKIIELMSKKAWQPYQNML